jgi:hypothetical protein
VLVPEDALVPEHTAGAALQFPVFALAAQYHVRCAASLQS